MDYASSNLKLGTRDSRKIGNNTYLQRRGDGSIAVRLHSTDILTFYPDGRTVYSTGGWKTSTTKARMNECGTQSFQIYTRRGIWHLVGSGGWDKRLTFADGLTTHADGTVTGQGTAPDERGDKRAIKKYVAAYMAAFEAGEVPAPGPGDCFYCGLREVGSGRPLGEVSGGGDHIRSHFEERYYVPSLLSRALETFGASPVARNWVAAFWGTSAPAEAREQVKGTDFYARNGRETCVKVLRRYLLRQLGYAV